MSSQIGLVVIFQSIIAAVKCFAVAQEKAVAALHPSVAATTSSPNIAT